MTAFRIAAPDKIQPYGKTTGRVKSGTYLDWIRTLPCVLLRERPVEAAHVSFENKSYGAPGRGKGQKVSDRWALPLSGDKHASQHAWGDEQDWWA